MKISYSLLLLALLATSAAMPGTAKTLTLCFENGITSQRWHQLLVNGFADAPVSLGTISNQLVNCLSASEPSVRDGIGFTGLSVLLREEKLSRLKREALFQKFIEDIKKNNNNESGVYLPFAVLALSEVLRADRIRPGLDSSQRQHAIDTIDDYINTLQDYRGFDSKIGWRHGIAHSADALLQLALNRATTPEQLKQISHVILTAITPNDATHMFIYGEPMRLARAMGYVILREEVPVSYWSEQLRQAASPAPLDSWQQTYHSMESLSRQHNIRSFYNELLAFVAYQNNERLTTLAPEVAEIARSIK
ncbi:DUF2785 domain-containing protein [Alteromonas pelagimontana]|uniref:DUF2785 domain-containing protein n=1 Tax=Alteromonas pelagimontana TaxID=1858656 RepID=A0A6M4MA11_9ALTE|nr:DUF2785 domain-containing protein [Alteromonas pelagimontana]QJR79520.1 DUF2785 domain-containing protein [Alteromonas pelagimontana]